VIDICAKVIYFGRK